MAGAGYDAKWQFPHEFKYTGSGKSRKRDRVLGMAKSTIPMCWSSIKTAEETISDLELYLHTHETDREVVVEVISRADGDVWKPRGHLHAKSLPEAIDALREYTATGSSRHIRAELPFHRTGLNNEISLAEPMAEFVGKIFFKGLDGQGWALEKAGKPGGLSSGGKLAGTYTHHEQRAFIKRDSDLEPQIAEVLASRLMNAVLPGVAVFVELVKPEWSEVLNKDCVDSWRDVYVASHHHPQFVSVLSEHDAVKSAYGGKFEPWLFDTPLKRGDGYLEKAFPDGSGLFNLRSLQKALIGNLLVANNDMHLGNMILFGTPGEELSVCAFDFGAAFNMSGDLSSNNSVSLKAYRGAIRSEGVNQFLNYPVSWTSDSASFWTEVANLPNFAEEHFEEAFDELKMYYDDVVLIRFLRRRVMIGEKSDLDSSPADALLDAYIRQFRELMCLRLDNFKAEAPARLRELGRGLGQEGL